MSIDHGKLLARLREIANGLADQQAMPDDTWERLWDEAIATAQPAEAVEADGEVYALPTGEHRVQLAKHARDLPVGTKLYAAVPTHDAAQGAVAWHLESKVVKNGCATRDLWWSEPGAGIRETFNVRPLIFGDTHPQAAPALMSSQDDWTVLDCPHCGKCVTYSKKAASSKDAYRDLTQEVESLRELLGQAAPAQGGLALPDSRMDAALDLLCGLTGEHRQRITDDVRMDHLCDTARQIAALASPAQGDGWKLVPVEATMEMLTAGAVARAKDAGEDHYDDAKLIYEAMIAAAPSQEGES